MHRTLVIQVEDTSNSPFDGSEYMKRSRLELGGFQFGGGVGGQGKHDEDDDDDALRRRVRAAGDADRF